MRDVVQVVLEPFTQTGVAAPAVDLRPTGDAGFDAVTRHVIGNCLAELTDEHRPLRARTDQTHVAAHDVDELRQLVDAGAAQERAKPRPSRVVLDGPYRPR